MHVNSQTSIVVTVTTIESDVHMNNTRHLIAIFLEFFLGGVAKFKFSINLTLPLHVIVLITATPGAWCQMHGAGCIGSLNSVNLSL